MSKEKKSLLARILDLFMGTDDLEREKKRVLKGIENQLAKKGKYYKVANHLLQPSLGRFFFDIYSTTFTTKSLLANLGKSSQLKNIVIESFLDKTRRDFISGFSSEEIKQRLGKTGVSQLQEELKQELAAVLQYLNSNDIANQINFTYTHLQAFADFITFDFYHIIKQFDPNTPENDMNYRPKLTAIPGEMMADDFDDFLHLAHPMVDEINWDKLFDVLKNYRNTEIISRDAWRKVVASMRELLREEVFELIIRNLKQDPFYEVKVTLSVSDIVRPYTNKLKTVVEGYIKQIGQMEKSKAVDKLSVEIFEQTPVPTILNNYTHGKHESMFGNHDVAGFAYAEVMNALISFGDDYLKKEVKNLVDLLILKGKWSQNVHYKDFSKSFQELLSNYDLIVKFDKTTVADESTAMMRLRNALRSVDRDKFAINTVKGILGEINDEAKELLIVATQNYIVIAKALKNYIDDYKLKPKSEIIINWDEVEKGVDHPLGKTMATLYTKIYYLIQLCQYYNRD